MLSGDDREWLEVKFSRVHERMDGLDEKIGKKGSDIHSINTELVRLAASECQDVKAHEDHYHNPAKTWGIMAAMVSVFAGAVELAKWIFKRGGA